MRCERTRVSAEHTTHDVDDVLLLEHAQKVVDDVAAALDDLARSIVTYGADEHTAVAA